MDKLIHDCAEPDLISRKSSYIDLRNNTALVFTDQFKNRSYSFRVWIPHWHLHYSDGSWGHLFATGDTYRDAWDHLLAMIDSPFVQKGGSCCRAWCPLFSPQR